MERIILHIDMDAFFAAIEERNNPRFVGKPVVVGADPAKGLGRGVVSTANYVARKFGIHSALPISKAWQLCPNAIFLQPDMELYERVSMEIMEICRKFSPQIEQVSLDEAYLDISYLLNCSRVDSDKIFSGDAVISWWKFCSPSPRQVAGAPQKSLSKSYELARYLGEKLKKEIWEKEKLTATVGIGPNKLVAKIASENDKPNGLLVVKPDEVEEFLSPLDIEEVWGIGPKTAQKLRPLGINKISDLRKLSQKKLIEMFGKAGGYFFERSRGIDEDSVILEKEAKSIGKEHTFGRDTRDSKEIFEIFEQLAKRIYNEAIQEGFSFKTITVVCRFSGFETHTKAKTLERTTQDYKIFEKEAKMLLLKFLLENPKPVRLVGVRISTFGSAQA
jgi:DNA polymerase IV (archaeal DinB-like DNA polymerase)